MEGQGACERQKTESEAQRNAFGRHSVDDHSHGIVKGGERKEQADKQSKGRIEKDERINQGSNGNSNQSPEEKGDAPNQNITEESNSSRQVEIDLTEEAFDDNGILEDLAIIARIIGPKKPRQIINPWIKDNWGNQIVVKFLLKGFFVVIFTEKGKRDQILCSKNWFFDNLPLYIQPWTPNFNLLKLAIYETLVWIRLFNLPIEYWGDSCLEKIGRTLGTLLEIDDVVVQTKREKMMSWID
ncbi:hypothetical protein SUGI_0478250 [Cryptomeria japonica]|nr:hypothetical protein SUGI_0478250 [Cryptomeria japonica]